MINLLNGQAALINIPKVCDPRGNLSFVENATHLPFDIGQVRWICDIPAGSCSEGVSADRRGLLVVMSGAVDLRVTADGLSPVELRQSDPALGLMLAPGVEYQLTGCSSNAVLAFVESGSPERLTGACVSRAADDSHRYSSVGECRFIELPHRRWGAATATEVVADQLPFGICRAFYIYDVPGDSERGGHSHYDEQCLLVALSGCFDVKVSDGASQRTFTLNRPYRGLLVPPGLWRELGNFSSGSVCLALSSIPYRESDYVRSAEEFGRLTAHKRS